MQFVRASLKFKDEASFGGNDAGAESQRTYWLSELHERNTARHCEDHQRNSFTVVACNQISVA